MLKITQDIYLEELASKCTKCEEEQICYSDIIAPTYCMKCNNKLYPNPYTLFHNQLYRATYHFSKNGKENTNEK